MYIIAGVTRLSKQPAKVVQVSYVQLCCWWLHVPHMEVVVLAADATFSATIIFVTERKVFP